MRAKKLLEWARRGPALDKGLIARKQASELKLSVDSLPGKNVEIDDHGEEHSDLEADCFTRRHWHPDA